MWKYRQALKENEQKRLSFNFQMSRSLCERKTIPPPKKKKIEKNKSKILTVLP